MTSIIGVASLPPARVPPSVHATAFLFFVMREVAAAVPCEIQRGGSVSVSRVFMSLFSFSGCSVALEPLGFNW